mmetsp:Transcript_12594/g.18833  ORF Transcript_12594/g.18833 Transcript_12594/m.18833 type:complete len:498 (+) Transcript_12594:73-1566(+)
MGCCAATSDDTENKAKTEGGLHHHLLKTDRETKNIWKIFQKGRLLGAGMTGAVHIGIHKDSGERFAIKSINKRKLDPAQLGELKNEVNLLRQLDHPNIVRLYQVYEPQGQNKMYLVMQLLSGKDLGKVRFSSESQVRRVMKKICGAIGYCHAQGVVHRDIKLENFVFTSKDNKEDSIVVIDFGIGKKTEDVSGEGRKEFKESKSEQKRNMKTVCGTPYYMSPQVLDGKYDMKCDTWALGVLAFILLTSRPPFNGRSKRELDMNIRKGVVRYPSRMSAEAKEFIHNLLQVNPAKRWSAAQAMKCKWFQVKETGPDDEKEAELEKETIEQMIQFQQSGKLKKLVLMIRAFNDTSKAVQKLKSTFDRIDTGSTGNITQEELAQALTRHNIKMDAKQIFESLDVDKRGVISYTEFLAASLGGELETDKEILKKLFDSMDVTKNGKITAKDLKLLLGSDSDKFDVEELLSEGDTTGNDAISFDEFVAMMSNTPSMRGKSSTR